MASLALCVAMLGPPSYFSQTKPGTPRPAVRTAAKPSLDALVQRVNAYWRLLAEGKKRQALEYVEKSSRGILAGRIVPPFSKPRIVRLEPTAADKEVDVTVTVTRALPPLPGEFEWPVLNQWAFSSGVWFVKVQNDFLAQFSAAARAGGKVLSPEETEKRQAAIRDKLRFSSYEVAFGTVREGRQVDFDLEYDLDGDEPFDVQVKASPIAEDIVGLSDHKLLPGKLQKARLSFFTEGYDGAVDGKLTLLAGREGIQVPFEFRLHGKVYTPLSKAPKVIRFLKGENEKKVEIRNNSSFEVRFESVASETDNFEVSPLPQILAPGGRCELTVKSHLKDTSANRAETILLRLAQPVDGAYNLPLPLITNFVEKKRQAPGPPSSKQIEELMRKNQVPSPIKP